MPRDDLLKRLPSLLTNDYIPHRPTVKQLAFLLTTQQEVFYGGAAGGGKSDAMLMAALQFVHVPGYSAVIFRRTYPQLSEGDGLIPRSKEWLAGTGASWNKTESRWTFPSGATLTFRHLQHEDDVYNHQGAAYQFVGFEELTQFTEKQYRYLFSRARKPITGPLSKVPIRVRATANPGGVGHEWVRDRFGLTQVPPKPPKGRIVILAKLEDNPHLDQEDYDRKLAELDPITYKQLRDGDWSIRHAGNVFRKSWFTILDEDELPSVVRDAARRASRYWDFAATPKRPTNNPDWTAGVKGVFVDEVLYLLDVRRGQWAAEDLEIEIVQVADEDGRRIHIWIEEEPGASGKIVTAAYQKALKRHIVDGDRPSGAKRERWKPLVARAAPRGGRAKGRVVLLRASWNQAFLDEAQTVTWEIDESIKDDQIDATAGLLAKLIGGDTDWLRRMMGKGG